MMLIFHMNKQYITKLIALVMLCGTFAVQAVAVPPYQRLTPVSPALAPPPLALKNVDGKTIDIKDFKGKVVLINFWATWCPPCRKEMPSIQKLTTKFKNKGLVVLAVNAQEDEDKIFAYINALEPVPEFTVLMDKRGKAMSQWGIQGLPSSFILNKKGKVVYRVLGGREFNSANIINKIQELIEE